MHDTFVAKLGDAGGGAELPKIHFVGILFGKITMLYYYQQSSPRNDYFCRQTGSLHPPIIALALPPKTKEEEI